jgi:hypothetical protein
VPLEARVPTVPPPIRDLVHHLLQRDRNKRPGDPRLVYDALLPYV